MHKIAYHCQWHKGCSPDMLRHVERFLNCSSILCPNKQTKSHRQLNVKGMAPTCNICNTKQKLYNFTTTALKAHLSTQSSSLSVFMVRKAHISAQKPHGRHLNTRGALCSQHFEYGIMVMCFPLACMRFSVSRPLIFMHDAHFEYGSNYSGDGTGSTWPQLLPYSKCCEQSASPNLRASARHGVMFAELICHWLVVWLLAVCLFGYKIEEQFENRSTCLGCRVYVFWRWFWFQL